MPDVVLLLLAASGTALATGLGAIPVFYLGDRAAQLTPLLLGHADSGARTSALVFGVLFVHSLPEGFAIGTAFASDRAGLSLFVILAIAIQNIPEGTSVAIPMAEAGFGRGRQFWAAVATSAPQPVGALIAFFAVEEIGGLLPLSFAFAAGAMLALIVVEMLPTAFAGRGR